MIQLLGWTMIALTCAGLTMQTSVPSLSTLDPASSEPIYRQLYWRFREAINAGLLKPGDRVPAARHAQMHHDDTVGQVDEQVFGTPRHRHYLTGRYLLV